MYSIFTPTRDPSAIPKGPTHPDGGGRIRWRQITPVERGHPAKFQRRPAKRHIQRQPAFGRCCSAHCPVPPPHLHVPDSSDKQGSGVCCVD